MKSVNKYCILIASLFLAFNLSSCLEEEDELYDIVGPVATIPVFSASKTAPVAGEAITLTVRFYSPKVAIKELLLNETVDTGTKRPIASKPVSNFDINNSYVETFDYTVPADASKKKITFEVVAVTTNDLTNSRTLTLTIP